jgi:hypothetical protein
MRKKIIEQSVESSPPADQAWLDLDQLAQVELTSESEVHPIESALTSNAGPGWRAAQPGAQTIRLIFDQPQQLKRIYVVFGEEDQVRTQEFLLRWLPAGEESFREIVRQQFNFSPPDTTREVEDFGVELNEVRVLELQIVPDIGGREAWAKLEMLQLA